MIRHIQPIQSLMLRILLIGVLAAIAAFAAATHAAAFQPPTTDLGDAPETGIAYPATGVVGAFPTCKIPGPPTWIQHTNFGAWFGPTVDFELDGNAGLCQFPPTFPPYDRDECFADNDAGLIRPQPFTIVAGPPLNVVPCPNTQGTALGATCQQATWGPNVDITVRNQMPNQTIGYVNVIIDWNQNGAWGGAAQCPTAAAPEHVLVNFQVPNPYPNPIGPPAPLSALLPPGFLIGPNPGYVWARFTITERPILLPWDGSGGFEDGESEDYLLRVEQPQAVTVEALSATAEDDVVLVSWRTVSEIGNIGFNLWRSDAPDGPWTLLAFVPSQAPGAAAGAQYQVIDDGVQAGRTYWYRLQDMDAAGNGNFHGPVSVTLDAPTVVDRAQVSAPMAGPAAVLPIWSPVVAGLAALAGAARLRHRPRPR
jgi:hypothetical protein